MPLLLKKQLLALLSYTVLAVVLTLPIASQLTTHVAGTGGDPWQTLWRFDHTMQAISTAWESGHLGSYLARELVGGGEPRLVNHTVWLWLPLALVFGQPLAYNLIWLLSFSLSGYFMYVLVRYLLETYATDQPDTLRHFEAAAFIAGVSYMFLPYHAAHALGHFGAMQLQWLPLAMLLLFRYLHRPTYTVGVLAALTIGIQALSEHHYALWLVLWLLLLAWIERTRVTKLLAVAHTRWLTLSCTMLVGLITVLPYWPTIREAVSPDNSLALGNAQTVRFSADLFSYLLPHSFHPLWGEPLSKIYNLIGQGNVSEGTLFVGIVPLLLILFFHQRLPKSQKYLWYGTAMAFALLSLGPQLKLLGITTPLPLPFALIDSWPVFSAIRAVARAGVMVGLAISVLVGWILATQARRPASYVLVGLLIIVEFLSIPFPSQSATRPTVYDRVKALPGTALLEIPAATNYVAASKALYASGYHGKEVLGNIALERGTAADEGEEARSLPALRQLMYVRPAALLETRQEFFGQDLAETFWDVASYLKVSGVVVHTDSLVPTQRNAVQSFLEDTLRLLHEEYGDASLYVTTEASAHPRDGVFLWRKDGWGNVAYDREQASTFVEISRQGMATFVNTTGKPQTIEITTELAKESHGSLIIELNAARIFEDAAQAGKTIQTIIIVPVGESTLTITNPLPDTLILQNPHFVVQTSQAL